MTAGRFKSRRLTFDRISFGKLHYRAAVWLHPCLPSHCVSESPLVHYSTKGWSFFWLTAPGPKRTHPSPSTLSKSHTIKKKIVLGIPPPANVRLPWVVILFLGGGIGCCVQTHTRWRCAFTARFSTVYDVRRRVFSSNADWGWRIYSSQIWHQKKGLSSLSFAHLVLVALKLIVWPVARAIGLTELKNTCLKSPTCHAVKES